MNLVASASHDGTIKIWSENNILCRYDYFQELFCYLISPHLFCRVISLNAVPTGISFCSQLGDLLLGINSHVHRIDYRQCMRLTSFMTHIVLLLIIRYAESVSLQNDFNEVSGGKKDGKSAI
jgi:WD40 repeat protein